MSKTNKDVSTVELTQKERPDMDNALVVPDLLGPVSAWSYSALKVFEECPYRTYISRVKRIQEPSSPAADRGTQIHNEAEDYVKGEKDALPANLEKFREDFERLEEMYRQGLVELEGEWAFDLEWKRTGWMSQDCWARIKLDAFIKQTETSAVVIDYKTGKKFGNEIPHSQQCLLYAIAAFMREPELEFVQTELWYLDHGEKTVKGYSREEAMVFMPGFHQRAVTMTTATEFEPQPSKQNCRWCSFGKGEEPPCQWGIY